MLARLLIGFLLVLSIGSAIGQRSKADSLFLMSDEEVKKFVSVSRLDPNRSALLSAVFPGLGQAYNGQYWKLPLVYGGGLIFAHYINYNHKVYNELRNSLIAEVDNDPTTVNPYGFNKTSLERNTELFRRNRDFLMILAGVFYMLNIVDAHVSAHLKEFDINENLSMDIYPHFQSSPLISPTVGIQLAINIR